MTYLKTWTNYNVQLKHNIPSKVYVQHLSLIKIIIVSDQGLILEEKNLGKFYSIKT
jgi:hypothetical protein